MRINSANGETTIALQPFACEPGLRPGTAIWRCRTCRRQRHHHYIEIGDRRPVHRWELRPSARHRLPQQQEIAIRVRLLDGQRNNTIVLDPRTIDLGYPLPPIDGTLTIKPANNNLCYNLRQSAYLTVAPGRTKPSRG
jgi:hypothetical protein